MNMADVDNKTSLSSTKCEQKLKGKVACKQKFTLIPRISNL